MRPSRWRSAIRRHGTAGVARIALARLATWLHDRVDVLIFRATAAEIRPTTLASLAGRRVTIACEILRDDTPSFATPPDSSALLASYLAFDHRGQRLYSAWVDGELAGWGLSNEGAASWPILETRSSVPLATTECAFTSFYVRPVFRGHRLLQALLSRMASDAAGRGVTTIWVWCHDWNAPSRRSIERVGFRLSARHRRRYIMGMGGPLRRTAIEGHGTIVAPARSPSPSP